MVCCGGKAAPYNKKILLACLQTTRLPRGAGGVVVSYCYDTMSRAWETLRQQLPAEVRDGELAVRFGFLIDEMHEANHRLKDAINHDHRVTRAAQRLDQVSNSTP